jgi:hypothetical protein
VIPVLVELTSSPATESSKPQEFARMAPGVPLETVEIRGQRMSAFQSLDRQPHGQTAPTAACDAEFHQGSSSSFDRSDCPGVHQASLAFSAAPAFYRWLTLAPLVDDHCLPHRRPRGIRRTKSCSGRCIRHRVTRNQADRPPSRMDGYP